MAAYFPGKRFHHFWDLVVCSLFSTPVSQRLCLNCRFLGLCCGSHTLWSFRCSLLEIGLVALQETEQSLPFFKGISIIFFFFQRLLHKWRMCNFVTFVNGENACSFFKVQWLKTGAAFLGLALLLKLRVTLCTSPLYFHFKAVKMRVIIIVRKVISGSLNASYSLSLCSFSFLRTSASQDS